MEKPHCGVEETIGEVGGGQETHGHPPADGVELGPFPATTTAEGLEGSRPPGYKGHSMFSAVFNFVNSIVGAGIMGLAFALNEAGLFLGLILLLTCAVLTDFSVCILVEVGQELHLNTLEAVCAKLFGRPGRLIAAGSMFAMAFGAMLAYLMIIGDTVPVVLRAITGIAVLGRRRLMTYVTAVLICFPLSAVRDIGVLGNTSFLSTLAVALICVLTILRAPVTAEVQGVRELPPQAGAYSFAQPHFFASFGAMAFAYVCQHSSFLVRSSMKEPHRWSTVCHISVGLATVFSLVLSLVGYLSFLRCTRSNLLNNLDATDPAANAARLMLAVSMFLTYPMEFFVARHVIGNLSPWFRARHWLTTILIFVVSLVLGTEMPQAFLGFILELTGGFSAVLLGFVLPSMCYLRHWRLYKTEARQRWKRGLCFVLLAVGVVAVVCSTSSAVWSAATGRATRFPEWCPTTGAEN
eukprot:RCo024575